MDRLGQNRRARHALADARYGFVVVVGGYEYDRNCEDILQPPPDFNPLAPSFETDVNHDDIGWSGHGKRVSLPGIRRDIAVGEAQLPEGRLKIVRDDELILDD